MNSDHPHRDEAERTSLELVRDRESDPDASAFELSSRGSIGRFVVVMVTLVLSLLPWLFAADGSAPPQREANRQRLIGMTVAERQRFDENNRLYREMSPTERDRLRKLQREIEVDPELQGVFHQYQLWADSLSPVDRHELRQAQDPVARRQLIEKFRHRPLPGGMPDQFPSDRSPNAPFGPNLVRQRMLEKLFGDVPLPLGDRFGSCVPEMESILRVLEREIPSETRAEFHQLDAYSRKVRVVRMTLERRPLGPLGFRLFGSGSETIEKVIAALPDGPIRHLPAIRNLNPNPNPNPNQPDPRGTLFVMVLMRGLMTETQRTIEDHRSRPEQLIAFQNTLPELERNRLSNLNREERQQELHLLSVKQQVPGIGELQQLLGNLDMDRLIQDVNNRFRLGGGPTDSDDRRDKKGRMPPPDGPRRPRDGETLPPKRLPPKD